MNYCFHTFVAAFFADLQFDGLFLVVSAFLADSGFIVTGTSGSGQWRGKGVVLVLSNFGIKVSVYMYI